MSRWFRRLMALSMGLLLLSGCITQQTNTRINADGSGTNEVIVGIDKQFYDSIAQSGGGEDPFAESQQQIQELPAEWNARSDAWEDERYKGVKVTTEFKDAEMLKAQLNRLVGPESNSEDSPTGGMFQSFDVRRDGDQLTVNATVNPGAGAEGEDIEIPPEMFATFKVLWSIEMPSIESFTEQDIAQQEGNKVTWTFPVGTDKTYNIQAVGSLGGSSNLLIYGLGGLIALGLLALLVGLLLSRRSSRATVPAAPMASYGQPTPPPDTTMPGGQPGPYGQPGQYGQPGPYGQPGQPEPYSQGGQYGQQGPYGSGGQNDPYGQAGQQDQNRS